VLAFTTVALGGFRGLIADALWIRAGDLQESEKYFEMVQLADWITKLEPHLVQVWTVQAWNMAYNISVKFPPEDRWRWVKQGIELLRDEALKYNPDEPVIYRELGWFYQHKMGAFMDDANMIYKLKWAEEMQTALGHNGVVNYPELLSPKTAEESNRVRRLEDVYKLDPRQMKAVDEKYGPLDWRLPDAHAIYWAFLGLQKSRDTNLIVLRRMIYQSMQQAYRRGALEIDNVFERISLGPNLAIAEHANDSFEEMIKIDEENRDNIQNAHKHYLQTLPYAFYLFNRIGDAQKWLKIAKQRYPGSIPENQSLDEYVLSQVQDLVDDADPQNISLFLEGLIQSSYVALMNDEDDRAVNFDRLAQSIWVHYNNKLVGPRTNMRVPISPIDVLKRKVLERLLDPKSGVNPQAAALLRTKLRLPAAGLPPASGTNNIVVPNSPATNAVPGSASAAPGKK
jgi:hypothetical protein